MATSKTTSKPKSAPKVKAANAKPKAKVSQIKKHAGAKPAPKKAASKPTPKLKSVASGAKAKTRHEPVHEHKHPFWKLLEAKEQQR
ncbi:MAG: hypothetical protein AAB250_00635, partial [Bdellovibrionota bacterium]